MAKKPSPKQFAVYKCWIEDFCNVVVNAVAGSGKTTLLEGLVVRQPQDSLVLAFSKDVQTEILKRFEDKNIIQGDAVTAHSLGYAAIKNSNLWSGRLNLKDNKSWGIVKKVWADNKRIKGLYNHKEVLKIGYTLKDMGEVSRIYLTTDFEIIKSKMKLMGKIFYDKCHQLKDLWADYLMYLNDSYEQKTLTIDYLDMVYLPVHKNLRIPYEPTYLMIDECQDLDACMHKLIDNFIAQGDIKKWCAVGDKNQAVYGFRGALSNSMEMFIERENTRQFPLDVCYRCGPEVIAVANKVYNNMICGVPDLESEASVIESYEDIPDEAMIVCRNSKPLVQLFFKFIRAGLPAVLIGDDIFRSVRKSLSRFWSKNVVDALAVLQKEYSDLKEKNLEEDRLARYILFQDIDMVRTIIRQLDARFDIVSDMFNRMKELSSDRDDAFRLCTIHKSKGMEADNVCLLNEHLLPSKFAREEEQLIQEKNLLYVARTRAKRGFYQLRIEDEK